MPARCVTSTYHLACDAKVGSNKPFLLMAAALVFFLANTLPISVVIALTENKSSRKVWSNCYFWSFPYYLVGAAAVGLVGVVNRRAGWQTSLLVLAGDLLGVSLLSPLPWTIGGRERASRS